MQNAAKRYDKNTLGFTQEVEIQNGDSLTKIAKRSLQSEGNAEPTAREINTRIAQIIAANPQIKDIDKLCVGTKIKVGTGQDGVGNDSSVRDRGTGTVPVKKSDSVYATDATKLIELIGENGAKYDAAVKDKPELEKELADVHSYLINKFNNDEYLTLDEQKIFNALNSVNKLKENLEKAKYPNKIKELSIPTESTPIAKYPDLTGYQKEDTTVKVGEGEDATEITVSKYTKEGQEDVYAVQYTGPIDGKQYRITASSQEAVLKLKADLEALALQKPADGKNLTAEEKRANLEKLIKIVELRPTEYTFKLVIDTIKNDTLIDKNDPEAKALVQKLLLTRNGDVISAMVKDSAGETDNTLFENDPVALKTMAAMWEEIKAKEKAGEKLTPDEIKLKEALNNGTVCFYKDLNGKEFYYNGAGLYTCGTGANNPELSQDFDSEMEAAGDDANKKQQVISKFLKDPRTLEDPNFKDYLAAQQFENASPADKKTIVEMSDASALAGIDLSKLSGDDKQKEAVKESFITRAKALFDYSKPADGTKPDPSNARYLYDILFEIDNLNEADDKGNDPDNAVIAEILNNFFVTTGEGEEQTVKIKDFRRFTYEEMQGLAYAVGKYGSDAQKAALANMITIDEMEDGQFVRGIEQSYCDDAVRNKYESFVDKMETKEEVLALIDKMKYPSLHIPFDKIMEKFGDDPEILDKLVSQFSNNSTISYENREILIEHVLNEKGTIDFKKYDISSIESLIPQETDTIKLSENDKKAFDATLNECTIDNSSIINSLYNKADKTITYRKKVTEKIQKLVKENPTNTQAMSDMAAECRTLGTVLENVIVSKLANDNKEDFITSVRKLTTRQKSTLPDSVIKKAYANGWLTPEKVNTDGLQTGKDIKGYLYGLGTSNDFWEVSKNQKKVNKDTIVDIIDGFNDARTNKNEGIIACMQDDGVPQVIINRYIKALMRKAINTGLANSNEFKALEAFFKNPNAKIAPKETDYVTRIFKDSAFDTTAEYGNNDAQKLDNLVTALHNKIKAHTRGT